MTSCLSATIVAKPVPTVLDQTFSSRDLFRRCARAWFWSLGASLSLLLLLGVAGLFLGLLADRGKLTANLTPADVVRFRELTGLPVGAPTAENPHVDGNASPAGGAAATDEPPANVAESVARSEKNPAAGVQPAVPLTVHVSYDEHGLLPSVWRARDSWWGPLLAAVYRQFDVLQSTILSSIVLLAAGSLLWLVRSGCLVMLRRQAMKAALDSVAPLRRNVHRQALRLGSEDLDGADTATAMQLFTRELEALRQHLARRIEIDLRAPLELAVLALVVVSIQPLVSAHFLLFLGVAWYYVETRRRHASAELHQAKQLADAELQQLAEGFQAARLVRGLGIEQADHDNFAVQIVKFQDLAHRQQRAEECVDHLRLSDVAACTAIGAFLLFILSSHILVSPGALTIADGLVFLAAWGLACPVVRGLLERPHLMTLARSAADAVHAFLERIPSVSQAVGAKFIQPLARTLHFDNVSYRLPSGRVILKELDLALEAGRTYSIVALDPLESVALTSLLPRFVEPQQGRILFDGEDIAWSTLESLRAEVAFVGADDPLLPGTVLDNIRAGRAGYTLQQATEAAKLTHAHNFIVKLFDGYESDLPARRDLMDVSQRFRLSLARAMIRNPALLIIQEPTVPLDEDTKSLLADAYDRICPGRTVIFLPGRMSTIRRSDQVIVVHEGQVAAIGPQSRLVSVSPIYRHWEYVNFNEFRHQDN